jgi:hypothetical protein
MKVHRHILLAVAFVALFSFSSMAQKVETDYDHAVDFSQLHTYSWGHVHSDDPFLNNASRPPWITSFSRKGGRRLSPAAT